MKKQREPLETLQEIRSLMDRSSRFLSLSGFSGVIAGITAIVGVVAVYQYLGMSMGDRAYYRFASEQGGSPNMAFYTFITLDFAIIFLVSLISSSLLTIRKARKHGQPIWDATARRLLVNLIIPLLVGGIYTMILIYQGHIELAAPATLVFYGLALLNASKYTLSDIRYLGLLEIVTGLMATFFIEYGLLFWAFGFGLLHIVYGIFMYYKYEK